MDYKKAWEELTKFAYSYGYETPIITEMDKLEKKHDESYTCIKDFDISNGNDEPIFAEGGKYEIIDRDQYHVCVLNNITTKRVQFTYNEFKEYFKESNKRSEN